MQATNDDRQNKTEVVNTAYSDGRLEMDELLDRTTTIWTSETIGELERATRDLDDQAGKAVVVKPKWRLRLPWSQPRRWILITIAVTMAMAVIVAVGIATSRLGGSEPIPKLAPPVPSLVTSLQVVGGSGEDYFNAVALDVDGSAIAVGWTTSTDGPFPPTRYGNPDALIAKYAPDGSLTWVKTVYGSIERLDAAVIGLDGSIFVAGIGSGDGSLVMTQSGRALVAKLTPDGELIWARTVGDGPWDDFYGLSLAPDGNIVAVGNTQPCDEHFRPVKDDIDPLIAKLSPDGDLIWVRSYFGNELDDWFNQVAVQADGSIVAVGVSDSAIGDYPIFPLEWKLGNGLVTKLTPEGDTMWTTAFGGLEWARAFGAGEMVRLNSLVIEEDGRIIVAGQTGIAEGLVPADTKVNGIGDALIAGLAADGDLVWSKTIGGDGHYDAFADLALTPDGNVVAVGRTDSSTVDFVPTHGNTDAVIVKLTVQGEPLWAKILGGASTEEFAGVTIGPNGSVIAVGHSWSSDGDMPLNHGLSDAVLAILTAE